MKKARIILTVLTAAVMMCLIAGCGKKTLDGDWTLLREENADGSVYTREDLKEMGISEHYHIGDDKAEYTCMLLGKEISFELDVVESGKNVYEFYAGDLLFQTVTLKGDIMTYGVGEGDDAQIFVFERDK